MQYKCWQGAAQDSLTCHGCTFTRLLLRCAGGFFDCIELIQGAETKQKSGIAKKS